MNAEYEDTLRALELVAVRRLGYTPVHFALVMPDTLTPGQHWGAACTWVSSPLSCWCGVTLRGKLVQITGAHVRDSHLHGHVCRMCIAVARSGLAQARLRETGL